MSQSIPQTETIRRTSTHHQLDTNHNSHAFFFFSSSTGVLASDRSPFRSGDDPFTAFRYFNIHMTIESKKSAVASRHTTHILPLLTCTYLFFELLSATRSQLTQSTSSSRATERAKRSELEFFTHHHEPSCLLARLSGDLFGVCSVLLSPRYLEA